MGRGPQAGRRGGLALRAGAPAAVAVVIGLLVVVAATVVWTTAVKISDAPSGAAYKSADGFLELYGDYGEMAITSAGKSIAIWGEGFSWDGPGGSWFNRQP